jgi:hypothetical protein
MEALKAVGDDFAERVLQGLLPMKGRMIHTPDGERHSQLYGLHGEVRSARSHAEATHDQCSASIRSTELC